MFKQNSKEKQSKLDISKQMKFKVNIAPKCLFIINTANNSRELYKVKEKRRFFYPRISMPGLTLIPDENGKLKEIKTECGKHPSIVETDGLRPKVCFPPEYKKFTVGEDLFKLLAYELMIWKFHTPMSKAMCKFMEMLEIIEKVEHPFRCFKPDDEYVLFYKENYLKMKMESIRR